ncbi:related to Putative sterigmatocystin biosynthesis lipase/esterase STCI [Fusarium oxysporum]|uniref:Related to Putative sterigmatocystin biosynthesis lipase/esterase STCI n=1 Tax=Fusarium oxysporum TaxID=5507 RepID=A0A2H3TCZ2_FUSOX|nr:related to Putative sterigmatocystin biosynthesis lipase/esterase STCI [Fusarium oxysporum]
MAPYLTPEWLEVEKELGGRLVLGGTMENYRAGGEAIAKYIRAHLPPPRDDGLEAADEKINENVTVRIYKPKNSKEVLPIGVFCHGGGFSDGSIDMEDGLCRLIASMYPCIIVSVEYRLTPAVDIKVVFQDAFDGFSWTYENASKLGGDQKRVFMLGSSCGGTLSLATAHRLIELGREGQLKGVINMAGGTVHEANVPKHLQHLMKSMEENATDVPIIDGQTAKMINASTGLNKHADDEWLFPLLSSHLNKFPSVYLVACGADPLRDDNVAMEHELRSKRVKVKLDMYEGLPHVFWMFPTLSATKTFIGNLLAGIKFILE